MEINGYTNIKNNDYICYLNGSYLNLISKDKNFNGAQIKAKDVVNKWIKVESTTKFCNYFFHVIRYKYNSVNSYVFTIDYYSEMMTQEFDNNFLKNSGDGILLSSVVIGEYIKDTIDISNEDLNSIDVKFPKTSIKCISNDGEYNLTFTYDFDKNPHYYGLSCLKPNLYVDHNGSFDNLIKCFLDIKELFAFIFRKRFIDVNSFMIYKFNRSENTILPICELFSTKESKEDYITHSVISSNIAKYFANLFNLIKNNTINCFHLSSSNVFEPSQLIMLCSWFEKLYKIVPLNENFELIENEGKKQICWKERTKNNKVKRVTLKQQLETVISDNPSLKKLSFDILRTYGGFNESERFFTECTKRVVDFRNDITHNKEIYGYDFIIQDRIFLELINYYLIFRYLCNCSEEDTNIIIKQIFGLI